jgi:dTMP kinase
MSLALRRGTVVVFEGLDKAGKSTQLDLLRAVLDPSKVVFAHMPSGFTEFTRTVYKALESRDERPTSGLSQQLAHLACHAESIESLREAAESKSLVLDRWWWSTLAYGWFGGSVEQSGLSIQNFRELIDAIWKPIHSSLNFVFLEPYQIDGNNNEGVDAGYRALLKESGHSSITVPGRGADDIHSFIMTALEERDLLTR